MRGWWRRLVEVVARRRVAREAADELAVHVEMLVARHREAGLSDSEARRQARLDVGSIDAARELGAEGRPGFGFEQAARDIRHAARALVQ